MTAPNLKRVDLRDNPLCHSEHFYKANLPSLAKLEREKEKDF